MNDLSNKDYFNFGRRKKRELDNPKLTKEKQRLAETMFTVCSAYNLSQVELVESISA